MKYILGDREIELYSKRPKNTCAFSIQCAGKGTRSGCMIASHFQMDEAIIAILKQVRPKLKSLMRTRIYYSDSDMILQFKTHILSIIEAHSGAIYHSIDSNLAPLDKVLTIFLDHIGMSTEQAFLEHNLLPLRLRRDIAILGFIHKANLRECHPEISAFFGVGICPVLPSSIYPSRHTFQLKIFSDFVRGMAPLYSRSILNMGNLYNLLPQAFVECKTVHLFQSKLTSVSRVKCITKVPNWQTWLSARTYTLQNMLNNTYFRLR